MKRPLVKDKRLSLDDTPIGECSLHFMENSRCELITGIQSEPPPLKGRVNEALTSQRRREGQGQCDGPSAAPPPPLPVSMFNYATITRIKPNSSIKDCSVIINAFKQPFAGSRQSSGVSPLLTQAKKKKKTRWCVKEGEKNVRDERRSNMSLKRLRAPRSR